MSAPVSFVAIVPARLASTRLPRKPLADLHGLPMVVRVAQRAQQSGARRVVVAADSAETVGEFAEEETADAIGEGAGAFGLGFAAFGSGEGHGEERDAGDERDDERGGEGGWERVAAAP